MLQQERSAILNPEHQGRGELLENPSTENTPFCNVAVFFSVFFFFFFFKSQFVITSCGVHAL